MSDKQRDVEEVVKKAVRDNRLSKDCFHRKDEYTLCYSKFGFYHNRIFLEVR